MRDCTGDMHRGVALFLCKRKDKRTQVGTILVEKSRRASKFPLFECYTTFSTRRSRIPQARPFGPLVAAVHSLTLLLSIAGPEVDPQDSAVSSPFRTGGAKTSYSSAGFSAVNGKQLD